MLGSRLEIHRELTGFVNWFTGTMFSMGRGIDVEIVNERGSVVSTRKMIIAMVVISLAIELAFVLLKNTSMISSFVIAVRANFSFVDRRFLQMSLNGSSAGLAYIGSIMSFITCLLGSLAYLSLRFFALDVGARARRFGNLNIRDAFVFVSFLLGVMAFTYVLPIYEGFGGKSTLMSVIFSMGPFLVFAAFVGAFCSISLASIFLLLINTVFNFSVENKNER